MLNSRTLSSFEEHKEASADAWKRILAFVDANKK